jgi:hypothetical protein
VFFLQSGERISPRFCSGEKKTHIWALSRLKDGFIDNSVAGIKLRFHGMLDAMYAYKQHDLIQWGSAHCEKVEYLSNPSVNGRYLGPHGWEVFVKPPVDWIDIKRYRDAIDVHWKGMFEDPATRNSAMVAVMWLIWLLQPLSHFSTEVGHVIYHAFELAMKDVEVDHFAEVGVDVFIQQMLQPNVAQMRRIYEGIVRESSVQTTVKPETSAFWRQKKPPTIGVILSLFELEADRSGR